MTPDPGEHTHAAASLTATTVVPGLKTSVWHLELLTLYMESRGQPGLRPEARGKSPSSLTRYREGAASSMRLGLDRVS